MSACIQTGIGRPLDFRHRSNRFVAVAAVATGLGALAWRWYRGSDDMVVGSFQIATGVFLAWAIGREIDPDDTKSATLATFVVLPFIALGPPAIGASAAGLIGLRIAVRTTGRSPSWIDGAVLTAAAAYLGMQPAAWAALAALILAMGIERFADPHGPARTFWFAATMTVAAVIGALFALPLAWTRPTSVEWVVCVVIFVAACLVVAGTRPPHSRGDIHGLVLSQRRLRLGRLLVVFTLAGAVIGIGGPAVSSMAPLWAAAIGAAVALLIRRGQHPPPLMTC